MISFLEELKKNVALLNLPIKPINVSLFSVAEPSTMKKKMNPMIILMQKSNFFLFSCNFFPLLLKVLEDKNDRIIGRDKCDYLTCSKFYEIKFLVLSHLIIIIMLFKS